MLCLNVKDSTQHGFSLSGEILEQGLHVIAQGGQPVYDRAARPVAGILLTRRIAGGITVLSGDWGNMKKLISAVLAATFLAATSAAAEPHFADYPTKIYLKGKSVLPKMTGSVAHFRTRINNGMKAGPNFGGHFTLIEIGCGSSCIFAFLIDARDGRVVDFPLGGEENYQLQMKYGIDSTLLQAEWMDTSVGDYDTCVRAYYDIGSGNLDEGLLGDLQDRAVLVL